MRRDEEIALKEQKAELIEELRNLNAAATADGSAEFTAEDAEKFDRIEKDIRELNATLERVAHRYRRSPAVGSSRGSARDVSVLGQGRSRTHER